MLPQKWRPLVTLARIIWSYFTDFSKRGMTVFPWLIVNKPTVNTRLGYIIGYM